MLVSCWSVKGGSGTTVVAASLAVLAAASSPSGALLVDLAGDGAAVLGLPEPSGPGLADWLTAAHEVDGDGLRRLGLDAGRGLQVLPLGPSRGPWPPGRIELLAEVLASGPPALVDLGVLTPGDPRTRLDEVADLSLLVLRPCYLALRRAVAHPRRPDAVVLIREPGRALGRSDVEAVLGVQVRAELDVEPSIARAVDAGLLAGRLPRSIARGLRGVT